MTEIGVLALQGDFAEHAAVFRELGVPVREVRLPGHLEGLAGLVIPGGESTTICRLMADWGLREPLQDLGRQGFPIWGTCAGMIVLARHTSDLPLPNLGLMDISVRRNAFGRQVDSFEADLPVPALGEPPFHAVFIRAPLIDEVGPEAETLARLESGAAVAARQGSLLATAFHPELTPDRRFHRLFLEITGAYAGADPRRPGPK